MNEIRRIDFKQIDRLRLDLGLGKVSFCEKAGISPGTYNRLANGNRIADAVIIRVAEALGVKASTIVYWEKQGGGKSSVGSD